jgi:Dihydrofolate reductase
MGDFMNFNIIAAIGKNGELGKDNKLIWSLPNDLKFFRETTTGKTIVMGRKTFESIGRPLPNRKNVVITSKDFNIEGVEICNSIDEVLEKFSNEEIFIIGGSSIYKQSIDYVDTMYLTEINAVCDEADSFFPSFNKKNWKKEILASNEDNGIKYKHVKYIRKIKRKRKF